jgi:hypothetical protein
MRLIYTLGSINSWSNTVLMKPFSTSVFKFLTWIFDTATKICTREYYTSTHVESFFIISTYTYSLKTFFK